MITVISGTNRNLSKSILIAKAYVNLLKQHTEEEIQLIDLSEMESYTISNDMYEKNNTDLSFVKWQDEYLIPSNKWVVIAPEYNGTFPGILKLFIDAISIRKYTETFKFKKVSLIGVADGRGGNLRGLDHLTTSMNYLGFTVFNNRLPISQVGRFIEDNGALSPLMLDVLEKHVLDYIAF